MSILTHTPVLLNEVIQALGVQPGGRYVDSTVGGGGHAAAILEHSSPGGQLLGIDADPEAIQAAQEKLRAYRNSVRLVNDNFINLEAICLKYNFQPVHGILLDLGLSSLQLSESGRGFSFRYDAPLDMRFSPHQERTAADIINRSSETELAHLIRTYGEETRYHQIAHRIVEQRPLQTTLELAQTIERATGGRRGKIHPATRTFQALRIAVNDELKHLELALEQAVNLLGFGGRLVVISYHSLEDRIVKQFTRRESLGRIRLINRKVITASPAEVQANPRSRSAKLRAAERIIPPVSYSRVTEELHFLVDNKEDGRGGPELWEKLSVTF
ncbi:MAG: 16S rRNA (cytosine(1402)-N(4))-methyltransferase RsmH [Dehalococcoidales bacterium]|nr:16S rRNA (cytosine(1402)-N(4))-methyltransferase RsmH [Dehalococcoidales bacterium]